MRTRPSWLPAAGRELAATAFRKRCERNHRLTMHDGKHEILNAWTKTSSSRDAAARGLHTPCCPARAADAPALPTALSAGDGEILQVTVISFWQQLH